MNIFEGLNEKQKEAVLIKDGPLLILAGAGSGKTRVLIHKIAYLISEGVNPFNILAITFTNKAAKEMKERVNLMVEKGSEVWVSTFHSTCAKILRQQIHWLGYNSNFSIYDTLDTNKVLKECLKELNIQEKHYPLGLVRAKISGYKDEMIYPTDAIKFAFDFNEKKIAEVYELYQKKLEKSNSLDFDDLIFKVVELFNKFENILNNYQNRFQYIMVDEYQDTNTLQYNLISLLARKNKNICVVGDDDQSIYSWRGANIKNILNFEKNFGNAKIVKLEQNYRSTAKIIDSANLVIQNNINRKTKQLWTKNDIGKDVNLCNVYNDLEEGKFISSCIKDKVSTGYNFKDFAILYRTNAQSRILEDIFYKENIPFKIFGSIRFYERSEIKDIMSYLKIFNNPNDDVSLKRVINVPKRGIGETTVSKISFFASQNNISFFDALKNIDKIDAIKTKIKPLKEFKCFVIDFINHSKELSVSELLKKLLLEIDYIQMLYLNDPDDLEGRIGNVEEFVNKTIEFEKYSEDLSLQSFLEEISLVSDIDSYEDSNNMVSLMTLHSSKGLEFPCVFIIGVEEGIFPSYRIILNNDMNAIEEERRLCYVGITRAEKELYLLYANKRFQNGNEVYNSPSRFIKELEKEIIIKKQNHSNLKSNKIINLNNYIDLVQPKNTTLDFSVGDKIMQKKYGIGQIIDIKPAGADYELTINFDNHGRKKFMAGFANLIKM